jgi:hypothetical protein
MVYANIIDVIGKKLYTGDITWIREYIQNAMDAKASNVEIRVHERDVIISDNGEGMGPDEINTQLFSIGGSTKSPDKIGQFGIGMYAGSGICTTIQVRTKKENQPVIEVELNMKKYREEIGLDENSGRVANNKLFDEVVPKIFRIQIHQEESGNEHFTQVKFTDVTKATLDMIKRENGQRLKEVLENYIPIEIDSKFPFKDQVDSFLIGQRKVSISLLIESEEIKIRKFSNVNSPLLSPFISREIKGKNEALVAKLWAVYSKNGNSLGNSASFLVKYKGMTVGDDSVLVSKFNVKDTKRYVGEIVAMNDALQLNTERSWFLDSPALDEFLKLVSAELNRLYDIANFDSKLGNGLKKKLSKLGELRNKHAEELRIGNSYNANILEREIEKLQRTVKLKEMDLENTKKELSKEVTRGDIDPYSQVKLFLANSISNDLENMKAVPEVPIEIVKEKKEWNSSAYIRTVLEKYIVDARLRDVVLHKNSKDTLVNTFTLIEDILKQKSNWERNSKIEDIGKLIDRFFQFNVPPDHIPENLFKRYYNDFKNYIVSVFGLFRNPAVHTFLEHFDNDRSNLQFLLMGDLILAMIESWRPKDPNI